MYSERFRYLTRFMRLISFYAPWKHKEISLFEMLSRDIK